MDEALHQHAETIADALKGSLLAHSIAYGELTITVPSGDIVAVAKLLRDDERCRYVSIIDVTAVDWPSRERRFDVVYHFLSPSHNRRIRVKAEVGESASVPSIIEVFPGTDWFERELRLAGVPFTGLSTRAPAERRGFEGHPLRMTFRSPALSKWLGR